MNALMLLADIHAACEAGYATSTRPVEPVRHSIHRLHEANTAAPSHEDARQKLAEYLEHLCTTLCISGEEYVRTFPAVLYIPLLTNILILARAAEESREHFANPFDWGAYKNNSPSPAAIARSLSRDGGRKKGKRLSMQSVQCAGLQVASHVEVLALRALALIVDSVPGSVFLFCPSRNKDAIPTLAMYLSDTDFLVVNEDLTEELLKCLVQVSLLSYDACVQAYLPLRAGELLLMLETHHLRVLCVQLLSNLVGRARELDLSGVWAPVLSLVLDSLEDFALEHIWKVETTTATAAVMVTTTSEVFSSPLTSSFQPVTPIGVVPPSAVTGLVYHLSSKDVTLLQHYMEIVAHAIDRLFIGLSAMKTHGRLLESMLQLCLQFLEKSPRVSPASSGEWLRNVALSPILTFFLTNPSYAVPVLQRLRVWDAVCGCMLTLVERRSEVASAAEEDSNNIVQDAVTSDATGSPSGEINDGADDSSASNLPSPSGMHHRRSVPDADGDGSSVETFSPSRAPPHVGAPRSSGPVLAADITTIPFIADELRLLPLLEFLLVLLPCARRGHSHTDYRNAATPYFRWTWEDDFHNETDCNEALSRRLERVYQQTRSCRTPELFAVTHGKQRIFYTDFLNKTYVSERRERQCLHRKPLLTGYIHETQHGLLRGCRCCASAPEPLFSTWVNRNGMRLRTVHTARGNSRERASTGDATQEVETLSEVSAPPPSSSVIQEEAAPIPSASVEQLEPTVQRAHTRSVPSPPASTPIPAVSVRSRSASEGEVQRYDAQHGQSGREVSRTASPAHRNALQRSARSTRSPQTNSHSNFEVSQGGDSEPLHDPPSGGAVEPSQRRRHHLRKGFHCLLCGCGGQSTATLPRRTRRIDIGDGRTGISAFGVTSGRVLTVRLLPLESMLAEPSEQLQSDPSMREAFLGKGVLSNLLPTLIPVLLSVLDNCVNPLVARHSVTLLLRCLSLSADLRAKALGDSFDISESRTGSSIWTMGGEKKLKRQSTFGRLIRSTSIHRGAGKWRRTEWDATRETLQRFLPSLREVLLSLHVARGFSIVAERQDFFGNYRGDLLMSDELARVGLSIDFCGFQLSLPSEQHICTADAMILLLDLFSEKPPPQKTASVSPGATPDSKRLPLDRALGSFERRHRLRSSEDGGCTRQSPIPSGVSSESLAREPVLTSAPEGFTLSPSTPTTQQANLRPCFPSSSMRDSYRLASLPRSVSLDSAGHTSAGAEDHRACRASIPEPPLSTCAGSQSVDPSDRRQRGAEDHITVRSSVAAAELHVSGTGGEEVFTAHQTSVLIAYSRQIMSRAERVCAVAQEIEDAMERKAFTTCAVIGYPDGAEGDDTEIQSKEFSLRVSSAADCPYHFSFPACTAACFSATRDLLQSLLNLGASVSPLAHFPTMREVGETLSVAVPSSAAPCVNQSAVTPSPEQMMTSSLVFPSSVPVELDAGAAAGVDISEGIRLAADPVALPSERRLSQLLRNGAPAAEQSSSSSYRHGEENEDIQLDMGLTAISTTIDLSALKTAVERAIEEEKGPYSRLPPALRGLLGFYEYHKQNLMDFHATVVEAPALLTQMAAQLEEWLASRARQREEEICINSTSETLYSAVAAATHLSCESPQSCHGSAGGLWQQPLRLDSITRGKLLCLTTDLGTAIGRDVGLASLDLAPMVVVKQPCSFQRRAKRMKMFGAVRHILWQPLHLEVCAKLSMNASSDPLSDDAAARGTFPDNAAVLVRRTSLPIVAGVRLRKSAMAVLPNATMAMLAAAVAARVELPSPRTPASFEKTKTSPIYSSPRALHAMQDRKATSPRTAPYLSYSSLCVSGDGYSGDGNSTVQSSPSVSPSHRQMISPDRILFFVDDVPMVSPLTTVLDALAAFAPGGASLRELVAHQRRSTESEDAHNMRMMAALPALPFWTLRHRIEFVVLVEPLPTCLILSSSLGTPASPVTGSGRCSCDGMAPEFYCSLKHLFDAAPTGGLLALYSALSTVMREEVGCSPAVLESNQRRLSSAVVHELYHQLNMFAAPPLMWSSGIGVASFGGLRSVLCNSATSLPRSLFPLPSYILWRYPLVFSLEMRMSILNFLISAQRSLSRERSQYLVQTYRHLLVHRTPLGDSYSTPSNITRSNTDKTLNIVGLQWLSEEVARRHRITLSVQRSSVLESAGELLRLATCNVTIDVAFENEAGIGNGPALEFYEMVAEELLEPQWGLWRTEPVPTEELPYSSTLTTSPNSSSGKWNSGGGVAASTLLRRRPCKPLFPAARQTPSSLRYWEILGALLGRLLVLGATTSLSFHPLLLRRLRGECLAQNTEEASRNLAQIDEALEFSLRRLEKMEKDELAACDLYFTIPASEADGYDPLNAEEVPLVAGGAERPVTVDNVREYTHRLRCYYLHTVPDVALLHLRLGLQPTVNPLYLELFTAAELDQILGSHPETKIWETREQFARNVEAAHGYHIRSEVVQYLLDIIPTWKAPLQHAFLKFVTGSSAVPYGGLTQRIKVVRRDVDPSTVDSTVTPTASSFSTSAVAGSAAVMYRTRMSSAFNGGGSFDNTLPTVSTCFLYLKLPQYSSKAVLQERLRYAVCEGQSFFSLT